MQIEMATRTSRRRLAACMGALAVGALVGWVAAAPAQGKAPARAATTLGGQHLIINGKSIAADVRVINGSAYVKLTDAAKALGMTVARRPGGYELTRTGGANQVEGVVQGHIDEVLFDGRWRFQVLAVETPEAYTVKTPSVEPSSHPLYLLKFDPATRVLRAAPGYKLVIIQCRMANGQKSTQTFWIGHRDVNNALADSQGGSHVPVGYDLDGAPIQSKPLLPGARTDFALLFSVPAHVQVKDLVFTLRNNDFSQEGNDVRVSLSSRGGG
jgi:hypothetical protein